MPTPDTQEAFDLLERKRKRVLSAAREYALFLGETYARVNARLVYDVMVADGCPELLEAEASGVDRRWLGPLFNTDEWEAAGELTKDDDRERGTHGGGRLRWWRLSREYRARLEAEGCR